MSEGSRVALDWAELEDESGEPAVLRRVSAPTIVEALEAMVADRQTDETPEQIEQGATADGTHVARFVTVTRPDRRSG